MLKKIILKNFRSHKNTEIELSPGITAIVGKPQSGKSNIIRGIEFLRTNKPKGNPFLPRFIKNKKGVNPTVIIETNKDIISLSKEKTKSIYKVNDNESLSAGQKVPKEVSDILNIGDINIHGQIQKPFLITDSPGDVIKRINKITKLEKVDVWIKETTSSINKKNTEIEVFKKENEEKNIKLEKLKNVEKLEFLVKKYDEAIKIQDDLEDKYFYIEKYYNEFKQLEKENNKISSVLELVEKITLEIEKLKFHYSERIEIKELLIDYNNLKKENNRVENILEPIEENIIKIIDLKNKYNKKIQIEDVLIDYNELNEENEEILSVLIPVENIISKIPNLRGERDDLNDHLNYTTQYTHLSIESKEMLNTLSNLEEELDIELNKMGVCNFCNTKLTKNKIDEIIKGV